MKVYIDASGNNSKNGIGFQTIIGVVHFHVSENMYLFEKLEFYSKPI